MAREYRDGQTNGDQRSPTSSFPSVRLFLVVAIMRNLAVTALDAVDQKQVMFVLTQMWIRELGQDRATRWLLEECSPGSIIVETNVSLDFVQKLASGPTLDAQLQ